MNETKTKFMTLNMTGKANSLVICSSNQLEKVADFVYLGAWILDSNNREGPEGQKS